MPMLHIIEGPVGAGKTTYGIHLGCQLGTPPLVLDAWMATLFRADRPGKEFWMWYTERKARCVAQILSTAEGLLTCGHDAIVELGLLKRDQRLDFYSQVEAGGFAYCVHLIDAPRYERLRRVRERNQTKGPTFTMNVTDALFHAVSDMWEPIGDAEQEGRDVRLVRPDNIFSAWTT